MRVQPQPMVDVLVVDIAQKIFISRDAERGWAAAPLDLKSPSASISEKSLTERVSVTM